MPVVSSLAGENQELIARYDCGLTYLAADGADCWHQLSQLLAVAVAGRRRRMGVSGKRLFEQHFNGESVFATLADHLERAALRGQESKFRDRL
jgi:hypothetical protein